MSERQVSGDSLDRILRFIEQFYVERGYMPTYKQIGEALGLSSGYVGLGVKKLWLAENLRRIRVSEHRYIYVLPQQ